MTRRSHRFAFSARHSAAVNALYLKQLADGLVEGPFPGRPQRLGLVVRLALLAWRAYR